MNTTAGHLGNYQPYRQINVVWWTAARQIALVLLALQAFAVVAAEPIPALRDRPPPGHTRALAITQTTVAPTIDGVLDDEVWKSTAIADRFWISEQERWPTEQTEVLTTADSTHLYFAFRVYESQRDKIETLQTRRDSGLGLDDQVVVELDPFLSHREVSSYSVNAAGTQSDAIAGGRALQQSWKGDWRAAATRTNYGWSAEIAIPFAILNYEEGATTFGVNFLRYQHRTAEWSRWADVTVRSLPEERGRLTGLAPSASAQTRPWTFLPYVLAGRNIPNKRGEIKSTLATVGTDIRYQPRPNLTGVLSLNPDFSQTENAVTDINFNYNQKFRADSRPFFQEGSAYFGKNPAYFYSNNVPNFDYGGKLFSRAAGYQIGALAVRSPDSQTDLVFRLQREIDATHSFGGMIVGTDQPGLRNFLYTAQVLGREPSGFNYSMDGALSRTDYQPGDGSYVQGKVGFDKGFWSIGATANRYALNYRPALGLLAGDLRDTRGIAPSISYYRDIGTGPVRELTGYVAGNIRETGDGRLQRNYGSVGGTLELQQEIKLGLSWNGGQYRSVGNAPGVWSDTVNHDHYWTSSVNFNTRSSRLGYGASYSSGFLGGSDYAYVSAYLGTRPTPTTFINANAERLKQYGISDQYIVSAGWDITPRHGVYGRYIWNDGSYYRLAYTFHATERIDFFAVYNNQPGADAQISVKILVTLP